jgi:4,5-dihydroxyphthalate decarboxylase
MGELRISLAVWDYDRTRGLLDGSVKAEGLEIIPICLPPEETFWRQVRRKEFDVCEMSLSYYTLFRSRGQDDFIIIPIFPSRIFRHSCFYVNSQSRIEKPQDLKGKKLGIPAYPMTAMVYMRGLLQHEYGVSPWDVEWYYSREELIDWQPPPDLKIQRIPGDRTLDEMLQKGEIAALLTARKPPSFEAKSPWIKRLFPNFKADEMAYYRKTKIFPIMHTIAIKRDLYEKHPWMAQNLCKAFVRAQRKCFEDMEEAAALKYMLPWLLAEVEEAKAVLGEQFWPYGVETNRPTIEALTQYSHEQGLAPRRMRVEELFAPETLDEFSLW